MTRAKRAAALSAAAIVLGAAIVAGVRLTGARAPLAPPAPPESLWVERTDTLRAGETLAELLARGAVRGATAARVLAAATPAVNERRVPVGLPLMTRRRAADSTPREVVFLLGIDHRIRVRRGTDSSWTAAEEWLPWHPDTIVVRATIASNLYQALDDSAAALFPRGVRAELAWALADIYEYRVDMSRELQKGDALRALVVRERGPEGVVRIGPVLAARFTLSGDPVEAIRFTGGDCRVEYFDAAGKSLRSSFLRAPLAFRRVSSNFGRRFHPILGTWRHHAGTDYAAAAGTPVRAIGDGTVTFAGVKGGYGRLLEVRHHNGFVSRYGHLSGFASGVRVGRPVTIGQTVAYVGSTGLATGPHLHFELLVGGAQRDPRRALAHSASTSVPAGARAAYERERLAVLARLDAPPAAAVATLR